MVGKTKNEKFLRNYGGMEVNDLTKILNFDSEIDDNAATVIQLSNYHDLDDVLEKPIFTQKNQYKVLSFNTESISSKFNNIKLVLELFKTKGIFFDSICINECWLDNFGDDLNLEGYSAFPLTCKTGTKGGLITYVQENYTVKDLKLYSDSKSWEGQFLEVFGNGLRGKLLLSNIYRPPRTSNDFNVFQNNFFSILNELADKYKHMIIAGDTNADSLQFNSNSSIKEYFDNLNNNGLVPVITLPTHFGTRNGSIIDHIYVKSDISLSNLYAGILLHTFSKHLPVFISIPLKNEVTKLPKFINVTKINQNSWENLITDLNEINWSSIFDTNNLFSNPSQNYSKFVNKLIEFKNKHMPTKKVRFKRYKHKNNDWITSGLLISIRQKDNLYKQLHALPKDQPNYDTLKLQYKSYEKNLKSLICSVKKDFYNKQFLRYNLDIKNTWQTIKTVLNKNRSSRKMQTKFSINGNIIEGDLKIANEFNNFFTNIGPNLASEIKPINSDLLVTSFLLHSTELSFSFDLITPNDILEIIKNFKSKSSSGYDNLNSIFIKKNSTIFNCSTIYISKSIFINGHLS